MSVSLSPAPSPETRPPDPGMAGVRAVLLAVGSRGDVQPMVTLGGELRRRGATVVVVALRDYAALVGSAGLTHLPIDRAMTESLAAVPDAPGRIATGTSGYVRGVAPCPEAGDARSCTRCCRRCCPRSPDPAADWLAHRAGAR